MDLISVVSAEVLSVLPGRMCLVRAGELVDYADTCAVDAGAEHRAWMRVWMDRMMAFAAWTQDLRIEVIAGEAQEPVTWSGRRQAWATEAECEQVGERWSPELYRVTRRYRVLPGPRGDCPLPNHLPPRVG